MRLQPKSWSWKQLQRPALYVIFVAGIITALWPLGEAGYGVWHQHVLRAQWEAAAAAQDNSGQGSGEADNTEQAPAQESPDSTPSAKVTPGATPHSKEAHGTSKSSKAAAHSPVASHATPKPKKSPVWSHTHLTNWPPIRLLIPDIGLDAIVVEGVDEAALRDGPGHDPNSHFPGEHGNCIIAAHRNMYGWWFYRLGQLGANSIIKLKSPTETYTYKVAKMTVTHATDSAILADPANPNAAPRLTLYTCAIPHGSKRIVVVANQVEDK